jgi:hypothetical protein
MPHQVQTCPILLPCPIIVFHNKHSPGPLLVTVKPFQLFFKMMVYTNYLYLHSCKMGIWKAANEKTGLQVMEGERQSTHKAHLRKQSRHSSLPSSFIPVAGCFPNLSWDVIPSPCPNTSVILHFLSSVWQSVQSPVRSCRGLGTRLP